MTFIIILLGYLIGSIPFGLIVGKVGFNIDIREAGSGNLGTTNAFRVLGKKAGFIVAFGDIFKGSLATLLPVLLGSNIHPLIIGALAVVGHTYPIFAGFKGGKAVATSAGVMLGYAPIVFLLTMAAFFILLLLTKIVSLSSMIAGLSAIVFAIVFTGDIPFVICIAALALFIIYRHIPNIKRIMRGEEPRAKLFKKKEG